MDLDKALGTDFTGDLKKIERFISSMECKQTGNGIAYYYKGRCRAYLSPGYVLSLSPTMTEILTTNVSMEDVKLVFREKLKVFTIPVNRIEVIPLLI